MDYETLRLIWWLILGVLLIGFAVMDGFDFGIAALLRVLRGIAEQEAEAIEKVLVVRRGRHRQFTGAGGRQRRGKEEKRSRGSGRHPREGRENGLHWSHLEGSTRQPGRRAPRPRWCAPCGINEW